MLVAIAYAFAAQSLFLPATTGYILNSDQGLRSESGQITLRDSKTQVLWGGYLSNTGKLSVTPKVEPTNGSVGYSLRVDGPHLVMNLHSDGSKSFDTFEVKSVGWYTFKLSGFRLSNSGFGRVQGLDLAGPAAEGAKFNLKPRLNAASVHIGYPVPVGTEIEWFYNEIKAKTDPTSTYYMACGFSRGYFGMQVNSLTERRIIFSVWDSGKEAVDRSKVDDDNKVKLLAKGESVSAAGFGNEGTGGHSHLVYPWKTNETQKFLVHSQRDGTGTIYTAYYRSPEQSGWRLIASFRAPKDGGLLRGLYSFNENFWGDNGYLKRAAEFGPAWIWTAAGQWQPLTTGRFTHDATGGKDRFDYDLTSAGTRFLLQNGGYEGASPKLGTLVNVQQSKQPPKIDFATLPTK